MTVDAYGYVAEIVRERNEALAKLAHIKSLCEKTDCCGGQADCSASDYDKGKQYLAQQIIAALQDQ